MGNHTDTRAMRRLPDSPLRIPRRLRFPILCVLVIDLALAALLLVIFTTPVPAHYPGKPVQSPHAPVSPTVETVNLPMGSATASKALVSRQQTVPAHLVAPTTPKPPKTRSAPPATPVPVSAAPLPTASKSSSPPDPTPTGSGD